MILTSKFITKLIITIIILALSITAFLVDKLFKVVFSTDVEEPQTNSTITIEFSTLFQREKLELVLRSESTDLANRIGIPAKNELLRQTIPYGNLNNIGFMTDAVINSLSPIFNELERRVNGIDINIAKESIRLQVANFLIANKSFLDLLVYYAEIFSLAVIGVFGIIVLMCLYLFARINIFLVTLIFFLVTIIMAAAFTVVVFIVPVKLNDVGPPGFAFKIEQSIILTLVNLYLLFIMFIIHIFMKNRTGKKYRK